jgi:hypothetical protein
MNEDQIEYLVKQAHQIFGKTSIYEVTDLDREDAIEVLNEYYEQPTEQQLEKYFAILDIIREDENNAQRLLKF